MKNLIDNIIDELEEVGIEVLEDVSGEGDYHKNYQPADREKLKEAIVKAISKSITDD